MRKLILKLFSNEVALNIIRLLFVRDKLTIILYHNPSPGVLDEHLTYLANHYDFLSLDEAINFVNKNDHTYGKRPKLLLTLDDGYLENRDLLPVFKKHAIKPVIYLVSDIINTQRHFWQTKSQSLSIEPKIIDDQSRIDALFEKGHWHHKEYVERQALNIREIQEMAPYVDFGSHTITHPILTKCDATKQLNEILESKVQLEQLLGVKISSFAYPNGDYSDQIASIVQKSGYTSCFTVDPGFHRAGDGQSLQMKRVCIGDSDSIESLRAKTTMIPAFIKRLF